MVAKKKQDSSEKRSKKKVSDLKLNKETVKDLTDSELKKVQGGRGAATAASCSNPCPATVLLCPHKTTVPAGCPSTVTASGCGVLA